MYPVTLLVNQVVYIHKMFIQENLLHLLNLLEHLAGMHDSGPCSHQSVPYLFYIKIFFFLYLYIHVYLVTTVLKVRTCF